MSVASMRMFHVKREQPIVASHPPLIHEAGEPIPGQGRVDSQWQAGRHETDNLGPENNVNAITYA